MEFYTFQLLLIIDEACLSVEKKQQYSDSTKGKGRHSPDVLVYLYLVQPYEPFLFIFCHPCHQRASRGLSFLLKGPYRLDWGVQTQNLWSGGVPHSNSGTVDSEEGTHGGVGAGEAGPAEQVHQPVEAGQLTAALLLSLHEGLGLGGVEVVHRRHRPDACTNTIMQVVNRDK